MPATGDQRITELRRRSLHHRRLARGPMDWEIAQQLDDMTDECDGEIAELVARR